MINLEKEVYVKEWVAEVCPYALVFGKNTDECVFFLCDILSFIPCSSIVIQAIIFHWKVYTKNQK